MSRWLNKCKCSNKRLMTDLFYESCEMYLIATLNDVYFDDNSFSFIENLMFICTDVFKSALKLGTFPAILVTYTASALLHVSMETVLIIMRILFVRPDSSTSGLSKFKKSNIMVFLGSTPVIKRIILGFFLTK